jgi:ubiquinone/menaquinone biosynthesis C-methylase UbiE
VPIGVGVSGRRRSAAVRYAAVSQTTRPELNVDYDLTDIPSAYDRGRDHGPEFLDLWMNIVASRLDSGPVNKILDLGCGTGRFSEGLAVRFDAYVIGVDPSKKMLDQARKKRRVDRVQYQRGNAEAIPLLSEAVDMIFMSMSFHHFTDPDLGARECRRVLRKGGTVVVRTGSREQISSYPYVPFFPKTRSMLEDLLPNNGSLRRVFETAGFRCVVSEVVTQTIAPNWWVYAEKLAAGGDSVLARLSEQELASGLEAVRNHDSERDGQPVVEPIDVLLFR